MKNIKHDYVFSKSSIHTYSAIFILLVLFSSNNGYAKDNCTKARNDVSSFLIELKVIQDQYTIALEKYISSRDSNHLLLLNKYRNELVRLGELSANFSTDLKYVTCLTNNEITETKYINDSIQIFLQKNEQVINHKFTNPMVNIIEMKNSLPIQIDDTTVLYNIKFYKTSIEYHQKILINSNLLPLSLQNKLKSDLKTAAIKTACNDFSTKTLMSSGYNIVYKLVDNTRRNLAEISVSKLDC